MKKKQIPEIKAGQRYIHKRIKDRELRIMAYAEKYCMVRLKGCMPFILFGGWLLKDYELIKNDSHE